MSAITALFRLGDRSVVPDATREGLRLTADARLDNRAELCTLLEAPAHATDADLILRAYLRWGETSVEHMLGDFAFVIWDANRQSLFCARDHMGVKPFYYHYRPGRLFACASAIKALLALARCLAPSTRPASPTTSPQSSKTRRSPFTMPSSGCPPPIVS